MSDRCGTDAEYYAHHRRGESPCKRCKDAHSAHVRMRRATPFVRTPASDRFWNSVDASGDCWVWTRLLDRGGYGKFFADGRYQLAHRYAYEMLVGKHDDGLVLDHLCRNRACVNPDHLEPVTQQINVLRGIGRTKEFALRDRCMAGHEYTEENTYVAPRGARMCRTCRGNYQRKYQEKRRVA